MEFNKALLALATKLAGLAEGLDNGNSSAEEQAARLANEARILIAMPQPSAAGEAVASMDRAAIKLLVAAGFVTEAKANEALNIAHGFARGPLATAAVSEARDADDYAERLALALQPRGYFVNGQHRREEVARVRKALTAALTQEQPNG